MQDDASRCKSIRVTIYPGRAVVPCTMVLQYNMADSSRVLLTTAGVLGERHVEVHPTVFGGKSTAMEVQWRTQRFRAGDEQRVVSRPPQQ